MYAQLVPCGTAVEERWEMERLIADQMIPALRQEPGFAGAWNLVDATTGSAMLIVLWESAEQARRPREAYGLAYSRALANLAAITKCDSLPSSVWEVGARI
jgi:hypothetical protein